MKKLILTSLILLVLIMGAVSAQEIDNQTDFENVQNSVESEISEIEINTIQSNDAEVLSQINVEENDSQVITQENVDIEQNAVLSANNYEADNALKAGGSDNTIYVSPTGTGSGLSSDDPASWDYAMANIQDDGIIYFLDGEYNINTYLSKNNLVLQAINAGSAVINANNNGYAFRTRGDDTKIIGLVFINSSGLAAVYSTYSVTVINTTFKDNQANSDGAAIYAKDVKAINSTFLNNHAGRNGGAIYSSRDAIIENSLFVNNTAGASGGAVFSRNNCNVTNSKFKDNNATSNGGAMYVSNDLNVDGCEFENNTARSSGGAIMSSNANVRNTSFKNSTSINGGGGAMYIRNDLSVENSDFTDNSAHTNGGAVSAKHNFIDNTNFKNNIANSNGGAVYGDSNHISDALFTNNTSRFGGAVYSYQINDISNSNFENNSANRGGAVYSNQEMTINNNTFTKNSAADYGGAAYANYEMIVNDCLFESNSVDSHGGAIYGKDIKVNGSEFNRNDAGDYGGAISAWGGDVNVENSNFTQNHAEIGGGAIIASDATVSGSNFNENDVDRYGGAIYATNGDISDSNFTKNNAGYSGGAVFSDNAEISNTNFVNNNATNGGALISEKANIADSSFIGNTAFDGAAIDCDDLTIDNSYFDDNEAKSYGVVYTVNATIKNSEFANNQALDNKQIYALNSLELVNTTVPPNQSQLANTTPDYIVNITDDNILILESGLTGYCTQRTIYWTNGDVYVMDDLELLRNQKTGEYIGEYLKILLYRFYNERTNLTRTIWQFTDSDFRNSENEYIKEVLRLYDSGFRVPNKGAALILDNNTQIVIDFFSAGKSSTQNLFLYNVTYFGNNYSLIINKIALNNTVKIGQPIHFLIVVNNTGDTILHNIRVSEDAYDDLTFLSWSSKSGNWNRIMENGKHVFVLDELYPSNSAIFEIIFNSTSTGIKTNVVVVSSNETNKTNSSNKTTVYKPGLSVQKITLTPVVKVGEITRFEIIVTNTGDVTLGDVSVVEHDFKGLIYKSFASKIGIWKHEIINNMHVFKLDRPLGVNESASFVISFLTTEVGSFTNTVVAHSNETEPVNGKNTTKVVDEKIPEKNKTNKDKKISNPPSQVKHLETGNPFAVLVLSMLLVLIQIVRRKD